MMVSGPSWLIASRRELSKPRISEVIPTIDVMPMTTPSTVNAERILLVRSVSNAIPKISVNSPLRRPAMLFAPQRFDGIQPGGADRRVEPEEQPDHGGDADADHHRPGLDGGRQRRQLADDLREYEAEQRADDAA